MDTDRKCDQIVYRQHYLTDHCQRPAAWAVTMPHADPPPYACQAHIGAVLLAAQRRYARTTTDLSFRVKALRAA